MQHNLNTNLLDPCNQLQNKKFVVNIIHLILALSLVKRFIFAVLEVSASSVFLGIELRAALPLTVNPRVVIPPVMQTCSFLIYVQYAIANFAVCFEVIRYRSQIESAPITARY